MTAEIPPRRPPVPSPARRRRALAAALLAAALAPAAAPAQGGWLADGTLASGDPIYNRVYLDAQGACQLSSFGSAVYYDVFELVLAGSTAPAQLTASLCNGTDFDSLLYLYQRADGAPGAFDPAAPCDRLIRYDDDFCAPQSSVSSNALQPGHVDVVVTSFASGTTGSYQLAATSTSAPLENFIFYSGFETGDARTWSDVVP